MCLQWLDNRWVCAFAFAIMVSLGSTGRAWAERGQWVVLSASVRDAGPAAPMAEATSAIEAGLGTRAGVLTATEASRLFEKRGSAPVVEVHHSDLEALARDAQKALYHVASGMPKRARRDVERALSRADRVLVSLNRQARAAEQLLDACLYLVRAYLQSGRGQAAEGQALECRRLVPDIDPDATKHPPNVLATLAQAEASLRDTTAGSLKVESEPAGCAVYANGRVLGRAPLVMSELSPGEYRLQAECEEGQLGRVHHARVSHDRLSVRIDTRFDNAVDTSNGIRLSYADAEGLRAQAVHHAVHAGQVLGVADVVLLAPTAVGLPGVAREQESSEGSEHLRIDALRVAVPDGRVRARVRFELPATGVLSPSVAAAVADGLFSGHFVRLQDGKPMPLPRPGVEAATSRVQRKVPDGSSGRSTLRAERSSEDSGAHPAAWAAGIVGTAGLATAWVLWGYQLDLEASYRRALKRGEDALPEVEALDDFTYVPITVASAGSLVTSLALPFLLPGLEDGPTAAAWVAGGFGAAGVASGVVLGILSSLCTEPDPRNRCADEKATTRLGPLIAVSSAPLLAVPIIYLLGEESSAHGRSGLKPIVELGGGGATLRLLGTF